MRALPAVGITLLRAFCKLLAAAALLFFTYFIWDWLNDSFEEWVAPIYNNWGIKYPYAGDLGTKSLDSYDTGFMLFTWLPILVAALATILLRSLPTGMVPAIYLRARRWFGRALAWQVPPRRFFTWWCGGMSVADSLVVAWLLAYNLWYFIFYFRQAEGSKPSDPPEPLLMTAVDETGVAYPEPRGHLMLERAGITFGIMLWPNIWMLFFPIPQSSFLQWLTGLGYTQMIRYHRWIGHVTMVVLSLHGWLYYIYWALKRDFWNQFTDWGTLSSINFLAGTIAYLFGLVLWATSISWVRRKFFEVFYRCHLVCFVGFTMFAYMHYYWAWSMFLPGLLLYAVDVALRSGQLSNTTLITGASVDTQAGVATLQLKASKRMSGCPVHELFMLVPSISRWQWHPISVAGADESKGSVTTMTLHIKAYGKWTKELFSRLRRREPLAVRLSAPVGPDLPSWDNLGSVLLIGGGIGATPLLMMLRHEIRRRRNDPSAASPRVHFVWASRHPREFCITEPEILAALGDPSGWLTMDLHCTGDMQLEAPPSPSKDKDMISPRDSGSDNGMDIKGSQTMPPISDTPKIAGACPLSSPLFHKHARVIQPQTAGPAHLAAVYLLAWVGALLGTYLGGAYIGETYTSWDSTGADYQNQFYWKAGLVWFFTQAILSIGLPFVLAVAPMHLWRYWRATVQKDADELLPPVPAEEPTGHGAGCMLVAGALTASAGEDGLRIAAGRPDLRAALEAAGSAANKGSGLAKGNVGVFVGGPEPLTRQVLLAVARLNDRCGGPHFQFHALAHSL
ncbi:hypothetical protein ABPG77_000525 [Micractinium sp. CCAP 211/92]